MQCEVERSTGLSAGNVDNSACLCKRGLFYNDEGVCAPCPVGADCSAKEGIVLTELVAQKGYWRATYDTTDFTDCRNIFASSLNATRDAEARCIGGGHLNETSVSSETFYPNNQCDLGYGGASCMACLEGYVFVNSKCQRCVEGSSFGMAFMAGALLIVPVFVGTLIALTCEHTVEKADKTGNRVQGQVKILSTSSVGNFLYHRFFQVFLFRTICSLFLFSLRSRSAFDDDSHVYSNFEFYEHHVQRNSMAGCVPFIHPSAGRDQS